MLRNPLFTGDLLFLFSLLDLAAIASYAILTFERVIMDDKPVEVEIKNLYKSITDAQIEESNQFVWYSEILIVCLLVWLKSGSFIWGVVTLIGLGLLMLIPYVKAILAFFFTCVWVYLAWALTKEWFEWSTVLGICVMVTLIVGGLHIGVLENKR